MTRLDLANDMNLDILQKLYRAFNSRDVDAALAMMEPDVLWANGIAGGHVRGWEGVRAYWSKQWSEMDSFAEPVSIRQTGPETVLADVHLTAFDPLGTKLFDTSAKHAFRFKNGLICRFDIVDRTDPRT